MWFFSANEAQFLFTVDGCSEELGVLRFSGEEALDKTTVLKLMWSVIQMHWISWHCSIKPRV